MKKNISKINWKKLSINFLKAKPFNHIIIDNFFVKSFALKLSQQFPDYKDDIWFSHDNPIEVKKLTNNWNIFPPETYKIMHYMISSEFINNLEKLTGCNLYPDYGLNGGGWHIHKDKGKLNIHQDYSIHPKLNLQRKCNIILFLSEEWKSQYGGNLELWSHNISSNKPYKKEKEIEPIFNRAIIFDTTQNSWHGMPEPLNLPISKYRKTLALYYLTDLSTGIAKHKRALFTPTKDQKDDEKIQEFIKKRFTWDEKKTNPY